MKTIKQWIRARDKALATGKITDFNAGQIMPIVGKWEHLVPAGKAYLFSARARCWSSIVDRNHESRGFRTIRRASHVIFVVSVAVWHGRKMQWLRGPSDVVRDYILPEGWTWQKDSLGLMAVDPEGVDYHPFWQDDPTIEDILQYHAQNKERRIEQIRERQRKEQFEAAFRANIGSTYVLLEDSRRAGNCVEGSLSWAEQRLNIPRNDILAAPFAVMVPASRLMGDERAECAAYCAFERETTISI
jgi:hypothetical protein